VLHVFKTYTSLTEEPEIIPALRVYLSGCNLRCAFCDTAPESLDPRSGRAVEPEALAREMLAGLREGARWISVLGGEPTLRARGLRAAAESSPERLPIALNTNLISPAEAFEMLDGVVGLYLADFKFGNDRCARELAGAERYSDAVRANLLRIAARTPVIVRHLLLPGHIECCLRPVAEWTARNLPGVPFRLYTGYVPCWRAGDIPSIARLNSAEECRAAEEALGILGLDRRHDERRILS
jgi:putative pyruvate formate lyase activating enzyme